jgi:hypothetical protein
MNTNEKINKYTLNITQEDLVNVYIKQWVLEWCKKYHPEAFIKAKKFATHFVEKEEI